MAHWIIKDKGLGGQFFTCSHCGKTWNNFIHDISSQEKCQNCGEDIDEDPEYVEKNPDEKKEKVEKLKERLDEAKHREPGTFERYNNDILKYLYDKFPHESFSKLQEAAAFISNRTVIVVNDMLYEQDREWKKLYNRMFESK